MVSNEEHFEPGVRLEPGDFHKERENECPISSDHTDRGRGQVGQQSLRCLVTPPPQQVEDRLEGRVSDEEGMEERRLTWENPVEGCSREACLFGHFVHRQPSQPIAVDETRSRLDDAHSGSRLRRKVQLREKGGARAEQLVEGGPGDAGPVRKFLNAGPAPGGEAPAGGVQDTAPSRVGRRHPAFALGRRWVTLGM